MLPCVMLAKILRCQHFDARFDYVVSVTLPHLKQAHFCIGQGKPRIRKVPPEIPKLSIDIQFEVTFISGYPEKLLHVIAIEIALRMCMHPNTRVEKLKLLYE